MAVLGGVDDLHQIGLLLGPVVQVHDRLYLVGPLDDQGLSRPAAAGPAALAAAVALLQGANGHLLHHGHLVLRQVQLLGCGQVPVVVAPEGQHPVHRRILVSVAEADLVLPHVLRCVYILAVHLQMGHVTVSAGVAVLHEVGRGLGGGGGSGHRRGRRRGAGRGGRGLLHQELKDAALLLALGALDGCGRAFLGAAAGEEGNEEQHENAQSQHQQRHHQEKPGADDEPPALLMLFLFRRHDWPSLYYSRPYTAIRSPSPGNALCLGRKNFPILCGFFFQREGVRTAFCGFLPRMVYIWGLWTNVYTFAY